VTEVGTSKIMGGQGLHNNPIGCGASGAYAPGPDDEEEEVLCLVIVSPCFYMWYNNIGYNLC